MVWNCSRCPLRLIKHKTEVDVVSLRDASLEFTMGIPELTNIEWIFNSADAAHIRCFGTSDLVQSTHWRQCCS